MNNKDMKLDNLKELGIYEEGLLFDLEKNKLEKLKELDEDHKENSAFMEPILYAIINEFNSYKVYEHVGQGLKHNLQLDINLSKEILINEPELIVDSPLAENKELILENKEKNPEIIKYISSSLENDSKFLANLCKTTNTQVIKEAIDKYSVQTLVANNRSLAKNETFMKAALSKDISAIAYADKEMLNSYDFFKEVSNNNKEVINYAIDNNEELGKEAILGVRDAVKDNTDKDYMGVIEENIETSNDNRYQKVKDKVEERGSNNPAKIRWITAMVAQGKDISPELVKEVVDYLSLSRIKLERTMKEEPNHQISTNEFLELITPQILNRLVEKAQIKEMEPQMQERIEEYIEFYGDFSEKFMKQKLEKNKEMKKDYDNVEKEGLTPLQQSITGYSTRESYKDACENATKQWKEERQKDNEKTFNNTQAFDR